MYAVNTECFLGDDDGNVRALRAHEVEQRFVDGRMTFEKVDGTDFELPCELVLLAMGFVGPQRRGPARAARRRAQRARQRRPRRRVPHEPRQRVRVRRHGPRPEPHRVGDRRGPLVRGRGRRVPHGRDAAPRADHARRGADALTGTRVKRVGRSRCWRCRAVRRSPRSAAGTRWATESGPRDCAAYRLQGAPNVNVCSEPANASGRELRRAARRVRDRRLRSRGSRPAGGGEAPRPPRTAAGLSAERRAVVGRTGGPRGERPGGAARASATAGRGSRWPVHPGRRALLRREDGRRRAEVWARPDELRRGRATPRSLCG